MPVAGSTWSCGTDGLGDEFRGYRWSTPMDDCSPRSSRGYFSGLRERKSDVSVIVAGKLYVDPQDRDRFVEGHRCIMKAARRHPGCLDLSISADPVEPGRVNNFEH